MGNHIIDISASCQICQKLRLDGSENMVQACILLKNTDLPVRMVAHSVSYIDPLYFSRIFHQKMGVSPSEYRNGQ